MALLATGSWALLLLDKEEQQRCCILEACHTSPSLLLNVAYVIIYHLLENTTEILELDAVYGDQKVPPVPGEKQHHTKAERGITEWFGLEVTSKII